MPRSWRLRLAPAVRQLVHFENHEGLGALHARNLVQFMIEEGDEMLSVLAEDLYEQVEFTRE